MAKQVKKENTKATDLGEKLPWKMNRQYKVILGCLLVNCFEFILISFLNRPTHLLNY
jgi:hypothetical protein